MVRIASPLSRVSIGVPIDRSQAQNAVRSSARVAGTIAAVFVLASAALSLYLAQVSSIATAGYQLAQLEAERKEWLTRNGQLELELAKRHSLVWSEMEAVQRFGMVRAERPVFVPVDPSLVPCASTPGGCAASATQSGRAASQAQTRPAPGHPGQIVEQLRNWLAAFQRTEE
jgi:hypothetical protein